MITMAKVFFVRNLKRNGWYYQIDMASPVGPFITKLEANEAAREGQTPKEYHSRKSPHAAE